jgi:hypothetical protein
VLAWTRHKGERRSNPSPVLIASLLKHTRSTPASRGRVGLSHIVPKRSLRRCTRRMVRQGKTSFLACADYICELTALPAMRKTAAQGRVLYACFLTWSPWTGGRVCCLGKLRRSVHTASEALKFVHACCASLQRVNISSMTV